MKIFLPIFLLIAMSLSSCFEDLAPADQEGLAPIYTDPFDYSLIKGEGPRESVNLGKVVLVGDLIYVNERLTGIHVIDNSDPSNPVKIAFIAVPGNNDFTVDGNFLYAGNGVNLLVIDISDLMNVRVTESFANFYLNEEFGLGLAPPDYSGVFECVDLSKGAVVGWEQKMLVSPRCYTR